MREINDSFLDWLDPSGGPDRPFFAFLNYFDAHEPFVPPAGFEKRFGVHPATKQDYEFLFDYVGPCQRLRSKKRDLFMARRLLRRLHLISSTNSLIGCSRPSRPRGSSINTDVIITSDHREAFGDHGICRSLILRSTSTRSVSRW